jgi:hypothetical protein
MRLLAVLAGCLLFAGTSRSQQYPGPVSPNYARAYNYFLNSPYSQRTFSSLAPAQRVEVIGPFTYQRSYREAGYEHQRISPQGFERHVVVPGYGADTVTPFYRTGYYVPGYTWSQYVFPQPPPPPRR